MVEQSFYWHDYETFGIDPLRDRAVQFAGLRTDAEFNVIGEPLVIYCQPTADSLPQPEACAITGITPQLALEKGVCEAEFIAQIHSQIAEKNTCTLGYNSLRFDDEVTRNLLYRNFYDPYAREWQAGNSRWDLIDLVRAIHALRPEGVQWPLNAEGKVSFRLEHLTAENGLEHSAAHDALSDVQATIALAKLLKQAQPKMFQFLLERRGKPEVNALLQLGSYTPVVHVSGMYGTDKQCLALVLPICKHPTNNNGVIVYDLSVNPEAMLHLSVEKILHRLFTPKMELMEEGLERIALKTVHINKCPVLAPEKVLRPEDALRLGIDIEQCHLHADLIQQSESLVEKLKAVFSQESPFPSPTDPDLMIYSGGFFSAKDKRLIQEIQRLPVEALADFKVKAEDSRLEELFFRYKARNYPECLTKQEQHRWKQFCRSRLSEENTQGFLGLQAYRETLAELKQQGEVSEDLLMNLEQYGDTLEHKLQD